MKKTTWVYRMLLIFCLSNLSALGQDAKIPIAIITFASAADAAIKNQGDVGTLQDIVTSEFVSRSRFLMLDRSKFDAILKELKVQKTEEFLDSKVVNQGRMIGAKYIVTGVVSEYGVTSVTETRQEPVDYSKPKGPFKTVIVQINTARINFSFQVIDVEKGTSLFSKALSGSSGGKPAIGIGGSDDLGKALCQVKKEIRNSIMALFPNEIHLIKLEEISRKGHLEKVLIDEGDESFANNAAKNDPCGSDVGNKIKSIFGKNKGTPLTVYEIEKITVNGKEIKREKTIGKIEVDKVEGETSVCNVKEGEKEIAERFNAGAVLLVKPVKSS